MTTRRGVKHILPGRPTLEGAGVHLKRAFGNAQAPLLDPFLLLDDFHSSNPADYLKGFPWHPHRGIETITYLLEGRVEHGDSLGNQGVIVPGAVQWMTAGNGIIHQEMPHGEADGRLWGFQLWANLPATHKMMPPRYRDIQPAQIPQVKLEDGVTAKVVCGNVWDTQGPVTDIVTEPEYLEVWAPPKAQFTHHLPAENTAFAYVIEGTGYVRGDGAPTASARENRAGEVVVLAEGDEVLIEGGPAGVRFLFVAGKPIREPVAWYGPIVMNTEAELRTAFEELEAGTFLKPGG